MIDLSSLNESQLNAVQCIDKPSLVVAGAGAGKTRVLTYKIAYLLEHGFAPVNILALTFTKKAANEMKERIAAMVGNKVARRLWMGTFHSVFMRILQKEHEKIGFPRNFTIYDNSDSRSLIKTLLKEYALDDKQYKPNDVFSRISNAKNNLISPTEYMSNAKFAENDRISGKPALGKLYKAYWDRCRQCGVMDFDDILVYTFILFQSHPDVCRTYSDLFRFILVDEYQDTNFAQHKIMMQLYDKSNCICVVGDDAQSIYSFRGAKIDNILSFPKLFPDVRVFKLEQNYRSTQNIVSAANSLIHKNRRQIEKNTFSSGDVGQKVQLIKVYTDLEEAVVVVKKIKQLLDKGEQLDEIAILYRTNSQSRVFEDELRKNSIPHKVYGGLSFYQRKEIKDVLSYFRLLCNSNDDEAFRRIVNYPKRGIGSTTIDKIAQAASQNAASMWEVASSLQRFGISVSPSTSAKLSAFVSMIDEWSSYARSENVSAADVARKVIVASGIKAELEKSNDIEDISKRENVEELYSAILTYCQEQQENDGRLVTIYDYITEISLLTDLEETQDDNAGKKVKLMTIHAAKGLEFANVFIVGLEEGLFPYIMNYETPALIEEERRLCYVAITRAKKRCYLSYALSRFRFGKTEACRQSRFITDIDKSYIQQTGQKAPQAAAPVTAARQLKMIGNSGQDSTAERDYAPEFGVRVGDRVKHERFGVGVVTRIEDTGDNTKAHVDFENVGTKQLLLKYAKIKIID